MPFYHLVCFLPLVGFQSFEGFFCHMVCLPPRVRSLSADGVPITGETPTISGCSDIEGFSIIKELFDIDGVSTIDGLTTTKGVF